MKRMCMSLVRLASPIEFGSEANDPVDLVFAFGAVDKEAHLQAPEGTGHIPAKRGGGVCPPASAIALKKRFS